MPKQTWCAEVKKTRHRILDFKRIQERMLFEKEIQNLALSKAIYGVLNSSKKGTKNHSSL